MQSGAKPSVVPEFTGERVVPGQVEPDLWNEHFSRYAFASEFAKSMPARAAGITALDLGCGTGYGSAELARVASKVTGCDVAADAIDYARSTFALPNLEFVRAPCESVPLPDASCDLITAFEVIEHLTDFRALLTEARRLLKPGGVFLVSTPNKLYYADTRAESGPNPFHTHEFEVAEFRDALTQFFPAVNILLQNRIEAFAFYPAKAFPPVTVRIERSGPSETSHFFLAVCSDSLHSPGFLYVPTAANLLRERERHIQTLVKEIALKDRWLNETRSQRDGLQTELGRLEKHLEQQNHWAQKLERELTEVRQRVVDLQQELDDEQKMARETAADYELKIADLEDENFQKTKWAEKTEERLSAEIEERSNDLVKAVKLLDRAEATVEERTRWAQSLDAELNTLRGQIAAFQSSRWVKLGRLIGLGPKTGESS